MDGAGEGPDRRGELRGGRQHFRRRSAQWRCPWLLTVWRHKLAAAAGVNAPDFVPVLIASEGSPATAGEPGRVALAQTRLREMASPPGRFRGVIEIEVSGACVRVEPGVDATTLSTVLSALRGGR
jgi:transposase